MQPTRTVVPPWDVGVDLASTARVRVNIGRRNSAPLANFNDCEKLAGPFAIFPKLPRQAAEPPADRDWLIDLTD